jgi:hypothetical protein
MKLVTENPYRTLGILVGSTLKEQTKQINKLKMFVEAEQVIDFDEYSFERLGILEITTNKIELAANRLNLNHDKIEAALFWFFDGYVTDAPAFELTKEGDFDGAKSLWEDLINKNNDVTQRSISAYSNLSTLLMSGLSFSEITVSEAFEKGISLKLKLLESDFYEDFIKKVTGDKFVISKSEVQQIFLKNIFEENEKTQILSLESLIELIILQNISAKDEFLKKTLQKPFIEIENRIEETQNKRSKNPEKSHYYANELIKETKLSIDVLNRVLEKTDLNLISISDKLANEILQCSIILFNHFHETDIEVGEISLELNKKALSICIGNVVRDRINESSSVVKKYIAIRPEREKIKCIKRIKSEFDFITLKLKLFQNVSASVLNARVFIDECNPELLKIKQKLGVSDELYVEISSEVVRRAQNMIVQAVNEKFYELTNNQLTSLVDSTLSINQVIEMALDSIFKLGTFEMDLMLKNNYFLNLEQLKLLAKKIGVSTLTPKQMLKKDLKNAEEKLISIQNTTFLKIELINAEIEMKRIKKWHFLRTKTDRELQIRNQQDKIGEIQLKSFNEKIKKIHNQEIIISQIKLKIQNAQY